MCACKSSSSLLLYLLTWYQSLVVAVRSCEKKAGAAEEALRVRVSSFSFLSCIGTTPRRLFGSRRKRSPIEVILVSRQSSSGSCAVTRYCNFAARNPFRAHLDLRFSEIVHSGTIRQISIFCRFAGFGVQKPDLDVQSCGCCTKGYRGLWVYVCKLRSQVVTDISYF